MRVGENAKKIVFMCFLSVFACGCVLTKAVTVPVRVTGAVVSVVPVAGNTMNDLIHEAADAVDKMPL